jgi:hypothetical protein
MVMQRYMPTILIVKVRMLFISYEAFFFPGMKEPVFSVDNIFYKNVLEYYNLQTQVVVHIL